MENPATVILAGLMVLALIIGVAAILAVIGAGGVGLLGGTVYFFRRLTGRHQRDDTAANGAAPRSEGG